MTAYYAAPGKSQFTPFGTIDAFPGPYFIRIFAAQGMSNGSRSTTSMDVSFDNLVVEAEQINMSCLADTDGDNIVGISDFLLVLAQWGPCPPECFADVDGDGVVGILDLLSVLADWGPCL